MDSFIAFFEHTPTWFRVTMLLGGVLFFWILEGLVPLFATSYKKYRHAGLNLFFTLTTALINLGLASVLVLSADYVSRNELGIIWLVDMPVWAQMIIGFLVLDFIGAWLVHWIEHKVKWMWKFHLIHHTDTQVDVTTGLRHHPGESIFRLLFTTLGAVVAGAPVWMVIVYQSSSAIFTHFNHANISLPKAVDHALSYLFVTPNMHKVHHHYTQPLTDTNYGNLFSIWDRIFGTYEFVPDPGKTLKYGIDTHMDPNENDNLKNLLAIPFQKYRPPIGKFSAQDLKETE